MLNEVSQSLQTGVRQVADLNREVGYLLAPELVPFLSLEAGVKLLEVSSAEEVDEPIANIALILDIARQVEEVISIGQLPIDLLRQLLDGVLIGYVSNHNGGP